MSATSVEQTNGEGWKSEVYEAADKEARQLMQVRPGLAVVPFGARKEIREIAYRVQAMAPGGMKYTPAEAIVLAQYAISLGANPLVGEVYLMKNYKTGEVVGLTPGIKLFRRKADEQDEKKGDNRWVECTPLNADERQAYLVPDGALAFKARIYNTLTIREYSATCTALAKAGGSFDKILEIVGDRPFTEGIGMLTLEEMQGLDRNSKNKMPHIERCKKRAEAAAIKVKYHLDLGFIPLHEGAEVEFGNSLADDFIDAQVVTVMDQVQATTGETPVEPAPDAKKPSAMYPEQQPEPEQKVEPQQPVTSRPYAPEVLKTAIAQHAEKFATSGQKASDQFRGLLCGVMEKAWEDQPASDREKNRHSVLAYLTGKDSIKEIPDWTVHSIAEWLNWQTDSGGLITLPQVVIQELNGILLQTLEDAGQQKLPEGG